LVDLPFKIPKFSIDLFFDKRIQYVVFGITALITLIITGFGYTLFVTKVITEYTFHMFIVSGLCVGLVPSAFMLIIIDRRRNEIDIMLPRVLDDIAEGLQAGMTLIESLEESSRRNYGFITKELKLLVAQMSWGVPIHTAFENFSKSMGTDMAKKTTRLILASMELGGDLTTVFANTSTFLRKMIDAKADRNDQLRTFVSIIYVTLIVFIVMMVMLYSSLGQLLSISSPMVKIKITKEQLKILLYDLAVFEGFFGGLIASKLADGTIYPGLKHSIIMMTINTVAFILLIG
jgi:flagellar protein FlaJ